MRWMRRALAAMGLAGAVLASGFGRAAGEAPPVPAPQMPAAAAVDVRRPKKLIAVGWDLFFDTKWLLAHRDAMETPPFDGLVLNAVGRSDEGRDVPLRLVFGRGAWKEAWFASAVEDIRACRFTRLTDNLLMVWANPGDVDWFDDAGWRDVVEHWRIAARVAKAAGVRGLAFDPEPYTPPHAAFTYGAQSGKGERSFAEYQAKVRQRGREVMTAVAGEFPDAVILAFFLNSVCGRAADQADPRPVLAAAGYGLLPAFLDGWLDVLPAGMTLVDGHESAYRYNSVLEFLEAGNLIRNTCQNLVSPENRARYRAHVQAGFGIYLDAYVNPPTSPWYVDGLGGPRVERLRANVASALRAADEFVWIYGEKSHWWPTPNKGAQRGAWTESLPGSDEALRLARDPVAWARWKVEVLGRAGRLASAAANGDFATGRPGAAPEKWSAWQDAKSHGTLTWDGEAGASAKGSARLAGVAHGCLLQRVRARPGQRFAVQAVRRIEGRGEAHLVVRWQTDQEKWVQEVRDVPIHSPDPRGAWGRLFGVAEVPDGAGHLVLLLLARDQAGEADRAWFDDVAVYPLD